MRKLIGIAVVFALLSFVGSAYAAVAINNDHDDVESYVGEATNINVEGQEVTFDGSKVTILANGHKDGVTTYVSHESNLTAAELAFGVIALENGDGVGYKYYTIPNGTPGQMVTIIVTVANGGTTYITDDKVDATTGAALLATGWDDIALKELNDSVTLLYVNDTYGWIIVGQQGATVT